MSAAYVLVVDQELKIQRVPRPVSTACGFVVNDSTCGGDALKIILASGPDVVMPDVGIPDMDGKDAPREASTFSKVSIIVRSACDRCRH
jgi:two-component system KDP operon response regulator KdpE